MKGIYSALIGTFYYNGTLNIDALKKVVEHNIDYCKVDGLYVNGSTGECFTMPFEYKKEILKVVAEQTEGRINLVAHVGSNVVEEILELSNLAHEYGYDAISAVTPFYYKFSSKEIKAFYHYIASKSELPLIIYNIPARTSVSLCRDDFKDLLDDDKIIGVKFSDNDFYLMERIRYDFPDKYIFSGYDEMLLSAAVLGIDGAIGSTYNIIGHWAKQLMEYVESDKLFEAKELQTNINVVVEILLKAGLMQTLKEVFKFYGIDCGNCIMPMEPTNIEHKQNAKLIYDFINDNNSFIKM